ncbi:ADP-ribosylation factor-like protein 16 [Hydra vulgaris]|uniref:ADP-ribosylation factor-like protein 16 n=1 Tax=Hydra vulgaris TaxID=6087 RepID=A0ABM4BMX5_HYDVU
MTTANILVLGSEGTGKSLLLKRLKALSMDPDVVFDDIPSTIQTVGSNLVKIHINKQDYELREVGGVMSPIWKNYYSSACGVIFVIDVSNQFQLSATCILLLSVLSEELLKNKPFLILLNKIDMELTFSLVEIEKILRIKEIKKYANVSVIECSCVKNVGLRDIEKWLSTVK